MEVTHVTLPDAWGRLCAVRSLRFSATSNGRSSGWDGGGTGTVEVTVAGNSDITFTEHGTWVRDSGKQFDFSNIYRWRFDWDAGTIRLEHLRYDPDSPVVLLDLAPTGEVTFGSVSPHRCGADLYTATVTLADDGVHLQWGVKGPKKDAETCCVYAENASPFVG
jgi:hypothetical protein